MDLKNAKIIITGGSSGIGKVTAQQCIQKGAKVLITGRDEVKLKQVADDMGALHLASDISKLKEIPKMAEEAIGLLGGDVDVLINNAGIGVFPKLGDITIDDLEQIYHTNVFGLTLFTQEVVKLMKSKRQGTIINIGSTASLKGFAGGSVYAASKFAVRGMTQSWQAELRKYNIRVCLVNPSEVTTAFAQDNRAERKEVSNKLSSQEIADTLISVIEMRDKGFIPEVTVWATNPFDR